MAGHTITISAASGQGSLVKVRYKLRTESTYSSYYTLTSPLVVSDVENGVSYDFEAAGTSDQYELKQWSYTNVGPSHISGTTYQNPLGVTLYDRDVSVTVTMEEYVPPSDHQATIRLHDTTQATLNAGTYYYKIGSNSPGTVTKSTTGTTVTVPYGSSFAVYATLNDGYAVLFYTSETGDAAITGETRLDWNALEDDLVVEIEGYETVVKHTVTYYVNGGSSSVYPQSVAENTEFTLRTYSGTRTGYRFNGWLYNGTIYAAGSKMTMGTSDMAFTADWVEVHNVIYNVNGGSTSVSSQTVDRGKTFTLKSYSGSKTGYVFNGWSYGGTTYQPGKVFTMGSSDMTFIADWEKEQVDHTVYMSLDPTSLGITTALGTFSYQVLNGSTVTASGSVPSNGTVKGVSVPYGQTLKISASISKANFIGQIYDPAIGLWEYVSSSGWSVTPVEDMSSTNPYTLRIGASAGYVVVNAYTTGGNGSKGSISPSGYSAVATNTSKTFTITPQDGYEVDKIYDNGVEVQPDS